MWLQVVTIVLCTLQLHTPCHGRPTVDPRQQTRNQPALPPLFPNTTAFVINLDRRHDRLHRVQAHFKARLGRRAASRVHRYAAVSGVDVVLDASIRHLFRNNVHNYRPGIVGNVLTMLDLWRRHAVGEWGGSTWLLLFEDDVTLQATADELEVAMKGLNSISKTPDIAFLAYSAWHEQEEQAGLHTAASRQTRPQPTWTDMRWPNYRGGLFAYAVSKAGAAKLIDLADQHGMQEAADVFMFRNRARLSAVEHRPFLVSTPVVSESGPGDSDIQHDKGSLVHGGGGG